MLQNLISVQMIECVAGGPFAGEFDVLTPGAERAVIKPFLNFLESGIRDILMSA
jgi:hypothetical protein